MSGFNNEVLVCSGGRVEVSSAQSIGIMQTSGSVSLVNYVGSPEGNVAANPSSLSHDTGSGNVYIKKTGTGNTGWAAIQSTPAVLPLGNVNVDLTALGVTTLFTTAASTLVIVGFVFTGISVTGITSSPIVNFGWTGPAYNDYYDSAIPNVNATGQIYAQIPTGGTIIVVPPSTVFVANVTSADGTATTDTQKITMIGFYI